MAENLAERIRQDRRPEGEMFDLAGEARRLRSALAVAQRWLEVATEEDEAGHLTNQAEYTRDQLEEELSRTAFEMEVLERRRQLRDVRPVEDPDGTARAGVLSDSLLSAYCALRDAPEEAFDVEAPERDRYAIMGALMAAMDDANAQMERAAGGRPAIHEEEDTERHTVEVTFEGEEVATSSSDYADSTLYRRPDGRYRVYLDARKSGDGPVLEIGHHPHGLSERDVRIGFPEFREALAGQ